MKKFVVKLVAATALLTSLSSCNKTIIDMNFVYDKVHLFETGKCYKIKEWKDYEGEQIQVILNNGAMILTSTQKAMLIRGECPICHGVITNL